MSNPREHAKANEALSRLHRLYAAKLEEVERRVWRYVLAAFVAGVVVGVLI